MNENSDVKSNISNIRRILGFLRLFVFIAILAVGAVYVFPVLGDFVKFKISWMILGGIAVIIVAVASLYYYSVPRASVLRVTFEPGLLTAVMVGTIVVIVAGVRNLYYSSTDELFYIGTLFIAVYASYIYQVIRTASKVEQEGEELREQYGNLSKSEREKSKFITVTSHQLRTPLTVIKWGLENISQSNKLDPSLRTIVYDSLDGVKRLSAIVEGMLVVGSGKSGAVDTEKIRPEEKPVLERKEAVDAEKLIQEVIGELAILAEEKAVLVSFVPHKADVAIYANREKVKVAVRNIIDNAIRYTPNGEVKVYLQVEAGQAKIRIEDTGIGINQDDYGSIFSRFFRGENAIKLQPDGSGMGLYTAKNLIEEEGGLVTFFSNPGKGTIFMINFSVEK